MKAFYGWTDDCNGAMENGPAQNNKNDKVNGIDTTGEGETDKEHKMISNSLQYDI